MKRFLFVIIVIVLALTACTPKDQVSVTSILKISGGDAEKTYTVDDLKMLGKTQASFNDITYIGVPLTVLVEDAGIDINAVTIIKAVAIDGFTANYESSLFTRDDTLVAYARLDGPLGDDEGTFRMVLPDQEGMMNPRELVEIIVVP